MKNKQKIRLCSSLLAGIQWPSIWIRHWLLLKHLTSNYCFLSKEEYPRIFQWMAVQLNGRPWRPPTPRNRHGCSIFIKHSSHDTKSSWFFFHQLGVCLHFARFMHSRMAMIWTGLTVLSGQLSKGFSADCGGNVSSPVRHSHYPPELECPPV